jgi:hypothetical protein
MPPPGDALAGVAARARHAEPESTARGAPVPAFRTVQLPQLTAKLNWRRAAGESKGVASLAAGGNRQRRADHFQRDEEVVDVGANGLEAAAARFVLKPAEETGRPLKPISFTDEGGIMSRRKKCLWRSSTHVLTSMN